MPSLHHEGLLEILKDTPSLLLDWTRDLGAELPEDCVVETVDSATSSSLDEATARLYFTMIHGALPEPVRQALEALMANPQYSELTSPFLRRIQQEGERRGREEGSLEALRNVLARVLHSRGLTVGTDEQGRIDDAGAALLEQWIDRALTATTLADVLDSGI